MAHKFLNDIGIDNDKLPWRWNKDDERQAQWKKERSKFGFDERDTWNLYYTITLLVYERLKYYREYVPIEMDKVDFSHTYEVEGTKMAYGEIIDRILKGFETYLREGDGLHDREILEEYEACWGLLGKIMHSLWW